MSHLSTEKRMMGRPINPFLIPFMMVLVYLVLISGFFLRERFYKADKNERSVYENTHK